MMHRLIDFISTKIHWMGGCENIGECCIRGTVSVYAIYIKENDENNREWGDGMRGRVLDNAK
jgi:Fe-S-cluster containining protein